MEPRSASAPVLNQSAVLHAAASSTEESESGGTVVELRHDDDGFTGYLASGLFSDFQVELFFSKRFYSVHKVFLAYESTYFQHMIQSQFMEQMQGRCVIELPDAQCESVWELCLRYIYGGKLAELDMIKALYLLVVADRLGMSKLMDKTANFLESEFIRAGKRSKLKQANVIMACIRLLCRYNFDQGDAPQRRVVNACINLMRKRFSTFNQQDLSFLPLGMFSQIVAGQASSMSRQAIMKHVQLHGDFMSLEDFEDLLSNLTTFDARSAIVFVQFAYKFRSKAVQSRAIDAIRGEFKWLPYETVCQLPMDFLYRLLKDDGLGVQHEDEVFDLVAKLNKEKKLKAKSLWKAVRFASCSEAKLQKAVELGAPEDLVAEAKPENMRSPTRKKHHHARAYQTFVDCAYVGQPFGPTGIFHWLGTNANKEEHQNPVKLGVVSIESSTGFFDSSDGSSLLSKKKKNFYTNEGELPTIQLSFKKGWEVQPTHYSLCHGDKTSQHALQSWRFEASADGTSWHLLREHQDDESLHGPFNEVTWSVNTYTDDMAAPKALPEKHKDSVQSRPNEPKLKTSTSGGKINNSIVAEDGSLVQKIPPYFKFFRIVQTAPNTSGQQEIDLCGVELFGRLRGDRLKLNKA